MEISENPFKADTSFLIDHVEYSPPSEYEIKMLEGTKNPIQQLELEEKENPILKDDKKMHIDMIKVCALSELGYSPLDNPSTFYNKEKNKLIEKMSELLNLNSDEIKTKFYEICENKLFHPKADYSTYTINNNLYK